MTKQKKGIYQLIQSSNRHLTAEEIFFEVRKILPSISLSTVYRNLGILVDEGKIRNIKISESKSVYDRSVENHAHIISDQSGKIDDVFSKELDGMIDKLVDGKVVSYDLIIHYTK